MDDIMSALSSALSDPAAAEQLSQIASSLMQENSSTNSNDNGINSLLSSIGQPSAAQEKPSAAPDISKLVQLSRILSSSGENDANIALLLALRPLLKPQTQPKLDRVVKLFRLLAAYPILRDSGILGGDLFA